MLSALEHYSYCLRQRALIHVEQSFTENLFTLHGRAVHEQVDQPEWVVEKGVRVEHALALWSHRLGLVEKADVVEFHGDTPYPVEYKQGSSHFVRQT
jgi:CRISPR-associated exonuclease Cas4